MWRDPIAVLTLLLFVIGGIQVRLSQRTAHRQLRAYLSVDSFGISDQSDRDPPAPAEEVGFVTGGVVIKNTGQTPAHNVCHWGDICVEEIRREDMLPAPNMRIGGSRTFIAPGHTSNKVLSLRRKLTPQEIEDIQNQARAAYIWGRIEYTDIFGRRHFTSYRTRVSGRWPPDKRTVIEYCEKGNEAD